MCSVPYGGDGEAPFACCRMRWDNPQRCPNFDSNRLFCRHFRRDLFVDFNGRDGYVKPCIQCERERTKTCGDK
jgi:hypothetical protein